MDLKYTKEDGSYYFKDGDDILNISDKVSILFDIGLSHWVLLKHGSPEFVQKQYQKMIKTYNKAGLKDVVADLLVMTGKFPIDELNHLINCRDYGKRFYEKVTGEKWKNEI